MTVIYEWDVETVEYYPDGDNDVHDHNHCKSYAEAKAFAAGTPPEGCTFEVVLVRDDDDRRAWAYVTDGKLPEYASDADDRPWAKVPQKFHKEVAKS